MAARATLQHDEGFARRVAAARKRFATTEFCDEVTFAPCANGTAVVRPTTGFDSPEAVALVASDAASAALVLEIARFLAGAAWLGKNVVAVHTQEPRCWLEAYIDGTGACASDETLRGGLLRAALVLDITSAPDGPFGAVRVRSQGHDGELPNLDFAHLAARGRVDLFGLSSARVEATFLSGHAGDGVPGPRARRRLPPLRAHAAAAPRRLRGAGGGPV